MKRLERFIPWLDRLTGFAWLAFWICLPVTSFRYLPGILGGGAQVSPLAIFPLLALLPLSFVLLWLRRSAELHLPRVVLPLLAFILVALVSSLAALLAGVPDLRGVTLEARLVRNLATLALGVGMYLAILITARQPRRLEQALRALQIGLALALAWGSLQIVYVLRYNESYFTALDGIQSAFSWQPLFPTRISGLAFEPSWFADQLVFLWLPWLLAAVLTGRSAWRTWRRLQVEHALLAWAVLALIFTYSRNGLLTLGIFGLLAVAVLIFSRPRQAGKPRRLGRRIALAGLALGLVLALVLALGSRNTYFARLWNYFQVPTGQSYLDYIAVGQRVTYWETAFYIFNDHPWLGVGLGNYAFYFQDYLPLRSWNTQPEVYQQLVPEPGRSALITPKNLFARLLAETGLIGTGLYLAWLTSLAFQVWKLLARGGAARFWGLAGMFALVAFSLSALSFDSFALPNPWVVFGLLTAAGALMEASPAAAGPLPGSLPTPLADGQ